MKRLLKFLWPFKPSRYVILRLSNGQKLVKAIPSQCGFICKWKNEDDAYVILLSDGRVEYGHNPYRHDGMVQSWLPHSGWDGTEKFANTIKKQ